MPGEHWVILGANGAGKSSLLSIVAGYEWPTPQRRTHPRTGPTERSPNGHTPKQPLQLPMQSHRLQQPLHPKITGRGACPLF
ncbi:MAG: ATP-binding cassette domain-containing protein [Myxococcales bacterium]|nr:ATP-binding cassette domain-containing protein [Myxococcales bacterium]